MFIFNDKKKKYSPVCHFERNNRLSCVNSIKLKFLYMQTDTEFAFQTHQSDVQSISNIYLSVLTIYTYKVTKDVDKHSTHILTTKFNVFLCSDEMSYELNQWMSMKISS